MNTLRSLLSFRRKTKGIRVLHAASKACVEGLESRTLLSGAATTTTLMTMNLPNQVGGSVTFTAMVSPVPTTGDLVNFDVNGSVFATVGTDGTGTATLVTSNLPAGSYNADATFTGNLSGGTADPNFAASAPSSPATPVEITSIVVSASPNNIASVGKPGTVTATMVPANAGGTVTFNYQPSGGGATAFASNVAISGGIATASTTAIPSGSWLLTAAYNPSGADAAASSNISPYPETISASTGSTASTTSNVTASPTNTTTTAVPVTLSATVSPAPASPETVTFLNNGTTVLGTAMTGSGTGLAMTTPISLGLGSYNITATYPGDGTLGASSSPSAIAYTVTAPVGTMTTSTLTTNPMNGIGNPVTLIDTVVPAPPNTESATFFYNNGANMLGPANFNNSGVATLTLPGNAATYNNITAVYSGDASLLASTSNKLSATVTPKVTTTTVAAMPSSPTQFNTPVTLTATISPAPPDGETVTFSDGGVLSPNTALTVSGVATLSNVILPAGMDTISASYTGDANFANSNGSIGYNVTPEAVTTVLSAPSNTSTFGSPITFTDTVTPAAATGTVAFFDNGNPLAGAVMNLMPGVYTLTTSSLTLVPNPVHNITAMFTSSMPSEFANSAVSNTKTDTITPAQATVNLMAAPNPVDFLSSVTFTAAVNGIAGTSLTGMVTFFDGATPLGMAPVVESSPGVGTAMLPVTSMVGTLDISAGAMHNITATYGGDPNFGVGVPSNTVVETIDQAPTTTTLMTTNANPAFGMPVTITATVLPTVPNGPALNGTDTVTFFDTINGVTVQLGMPVPLMVAGGGGTAAITTPALTAGVHGITATFNLGDVYYATSTSAPLTENVGVAATSTTLSVMPISNTIMLGDPVTLTATVTPVAAAQGVGGTVTFLSNTVAVGNPVVVNAGGTAVLVTTGLLGGVDSITAVFTPNATSNYGSSQSLLTPVTIHPGASSTQITTTLAGMPPMAAVGAPVTFTATVAALNPINVILATGNVTFTEDGTTVLGTVALTNGQALLTTTMLAPGADTITATYVGDTNYATSISTAITVRINPVTSTTSTTTLSTSINPITPGDTVTFTAAITPTLGTGPTPTGTVTFFDGTTPLGGAVTLSNGFATFTTNALPIGTNSITATYNGGNYSASTSAPISEIVGAATNFIASLSVSNNSVLVGTPVTLVGTVDPAIPGGLLPTGGSVTFLDNNLSLGSIPLQPNGTAAITLNLPFGDHSITVDYSVGSAISASTPIVVSVNSPTIPSIDGLVLPPDVVAGLKFSSKVPVVLSNAGPKMKGTFVINIYANTTTILDGNQVLIATMTKKNLLLNSDQSKTINAKLKSVPSTLPAGTYHVLVQVFDPTGASNLGRSLHTVGVLTPFVTLGVSAKPVTPLTLPLGASAFIDVTVTNTGNEPVDGTLNLDLAPSLDGATPVAGITLAVFSRKENFRAGQSRRFRLHFNGGALAMGSYSPFLTVSVPGAETTYIGPVKFTIG